MLQNEPLKTGFVVSNSTGSIEDLPVKLRFPDSALTRLSDNEYYVNATGGGGGDSLLLDQSTPQTIINGIPLMTTAVDADGSGNQLVNKTYVDEAVTALNAIFYALDTASGVGSYKLTSLTPSPDAEASVTSGTLTTGNTLLQGWISPVDGAPSQLLRGLYDFHIHAEKTVTTGTKTLKLYWELVERKADTSETVIATSEMSDEVTSKAAFEMHLLLVENYAVTAGSRIVGKVYANVSGAGADLVAKLYYRGTTAAAWQIPASKEVFDGQYWKLDQTTPQTVTGTPTFPTFTISSGANNSWQKFVRTATGTGATDGLGIGYDSVGGTIWNYENTPVRIGTNGTERMRILGGGGFCFGTAALDSDIPALGGLFSMADSGYGANYTAFRFTDDYSWTPGNSSYMHNVVESKFTVNTSNQFGGGSAFHSNIINAGSGARTSFTGFKSDMNLGGTSATITSASHFYAAAKSGNQGLTDVYGLYIEEQKVSGVTNAWGAYQVGANTHNYFQGNVTGNSFIASSGLFKGNTGYVVIQAGGYNVYYIEPSTTVGGNFSFRTKFGRSDGDKPDAQVDVVATGGVCSGSAPACSSFSSEETCTWSGCSWDGAIDCTQFLTAETCLYGCSWGGGTAEACNDNGYCNSWDNDSSGCASAGCSFNQTQAPACVSDGYCTQFYGDSSGCANAGCTYNDPDCVDPVDCSQQSSGDCDGTYGQYCTWQPELGDCYFPCSSYIATCGEYSTYCNYTPPVGDSCTGTGAGCLGSASPCSNFSTQETCVSPCSYVNLPAVKSNNGYQIGSEIADAVAPVGMLYMSSDQSTLCWKNASGTVYTVNLTAV